MSEMVLKDKVCIVTGTSRGIGKAIAENFAREGAIVYANARNEGCLDEWANLLSSENDGRMIPVYFDVSDKKSIRNCVQLINKEHGRLDVLVNNAGVSKNELIGMIRDDTIEKLYSTNVFPVIHFIQYASKIMMKQKSGSIINISSIIGAEGNRGELVYSGTKGAIIAMTKSASKELASYNIRVNSVAPGFTETDMFLNAAGTQENIDNNLKKIGFGRFAKPVDIANACTFLASDYSGYITGQILGVNGSTII